MRKFYVPIFLTTAFLLGARLTGQTLEPASSPISGKPIYLDGKQQRHQISPTDFTQTFYLEKLLPGESYELVFGDEDGLKGCVPKVSAPDGDAKLAPTTDGKTVYFVPKSAKIRLNLTYCADQELPKEHWLSLVLMTGTKSNIKDLLATLQVEGGYTAEDLVREVIIGGDCFDISNVTYQGSPVQIGKFSQGITNVGLIEGAILATGPIDVAVGPNDQNGAGSAVGGAGNDADLAQLAGGGSIFDLCDIEFDFRPTESPLSLNSVFASE